MIKTKNREVLHKNNFEKTPLSEQKSRHESLAVGNQLIDWEKAKDFNVWDTSGNKYIDMTAGIFVANAGHANPEIKRAIQNQLDSDMWFSFLYNNQIKADFIDRLLEISPDHFEKAVLLNSGSEITDIAIKLIKFWASKNNRKYTISLCEQIIRENLKIEFLIETHLKNLDDELIILLKKAGLKMVYVGIESSSPNVLKNIKRFTVDNDQQYQIIKKLKENGIIVKSMFMLANPDDSVESIKDTIEYSKFLPNQLVQFSVFTPYPGTPAYNEFKDKIIVHDFEKYNQYNLVYNHRSINSDILIKLKNLGYRKFYINIKNFFIIFLSFASFLRK